MPLPSLNVSPQTSGINLLKNKIIGKPVNDDMHRVSNERPVSSNIRQIRTPIKREVPQSQPQSITKVGSSKITNLGINQKAANDEANRKAIEASQGRTNPLLPILKEIANTLTGIDKTLQDILKVLNSKLDNLDSGLGNSGLGFEDWRKKKSKK